MLRVQPGFNHDEPTTSSERPGFVSESALSHEIEVALVGVGVLFFSIFYVVGAMYYCWDTLKSKSGSWDEHKFICECVWTMRLSNRAWREFDNLDILCWFLVHVILLGLDKSWDWPFVLFLSAVRSCLMIALSWAQQAQLHVEWVFMGEFCKKKKKCQFCSKRTSKKVLRLSDT